MLRDVNDTSHIEALGGELDVYRRCFLGTFKRLCDADIALANEEFDLMVNVMRQLQNLARGA